MSAVESTAIPTVLPLADTAQAVPAGRSSGGAAGHVLARLARMRGPHVRWGLWTGLAVAFAVTCGEGGLPTDRVVLLGWALSGLVAHAAVDGWRRGVRLLTEWLPGAALVMGYAPSRGLADGLGMPVHVIEPALVDRWLGFGALPTVVLQQ